jgi:hypothetical protein
MFISKKLLMNSLSIKIFPSITSPTARIACNLLFSKDDHAVRGTNCNTIHTCITDLQ